MTYQKMLTKINTAGAEFIGMFLGEILYNYPKFCDDVDKRVAFIKYMYNEYGKSMGYEYSTIQTKCYAIISIIEGGRVLDTIEHIINTNEKKVCEAAREGAVATLDAIIEEKLQLPKG